MYQVHWYIEGPAKIVTSLVYSREHSRLSFSIEVVGSPHLHDSGHSENSNKIQSGGHCDFRPRKIKIPDQWTFHEWLHQVIVRWSHATIRSLSRRHLCANFSAVWSSTEVWPGRGDAGTSVQPRLLVSV
jgi:hypothetical protein